MWRTIKDVTKIAWAVLLNGDPFGIESLTPLERRKRKIEENEVKNPTKKKKPIELKPSGMSYVCWGCSKKETIELKDEKHPSRKETDKFWNRWGTNSTRVLFNGDGTYSVQIFCPECQHTINTAGRKYRFGFLASQIAAILRDPERGDHESHR